MKRPNFLVVLIDDLRDDEFGAGGHPYMKTPHIDRIAREGAIFERAFHTTPICSPNRASIMTGQYASRHGIIDNVARDAMSHRLPNYHLALQSLGYETAHLGKWDMGNDGRPRPGYDYWVAYDGHGRLVDPKLNVNGTYEQCSGYVTDLMNELAVKFLERPRKQPFSLFFAHKAVHPDAFQAADGTLDLENQGGYKPAERHQDLYKGCVFPKYPNMLPPAEVIKQKPVWAEAFELKEAPKSRALLDSLHAGKHGPQIQGRSLVPLFSGRPRAWRKSFLVEYWAEQALPWLVGMTYKAVRTERYKYIHWVNRGRAGELDELYDLERDPWELKNRIASRAHADIRARLRRELTRLVSEAVGLYLP